MFGRATIRLGIGPHSSFDLIRCVGRLQPHTCTSMTSTPSKVNVKVMELLKLWKSHFSRSISSAVFAWSSKLIVGSDRRGRPWGIFFGFYKTRHILLSDSANFTVLRAVVLTQYRRVTDRQTDGRTDRWMDGIAVASTALALQQAVKIGFVDKFDSSMI